MYVHVRMLAVVFSLAMVTVLPHAAAEQAVSDNGLALVPPVIAGHGPAATAGQALIQGVSHPIAPVERGDAGDVVDEQSHVSNTPPLVVDVILALQLPDVPRRLAFQGPESLTSTVGALGDGRAADHGPGKPLTLQPRTVRGDDTHNIPRLRTGRVRNRQYRRGLIR